MRRVFHLHGVLSLDDVTCANVVVKMPSENNFTFHKYMRTLMGQREFYSVSTTLVFSGNQEFISCRNVPCSSLWFLDASIHFHHTFLDHFLFALITKNLNTPSYVSVI